MTPNETAQVHGDAFLRRHRTCGRSRVTRRATIRRSRAALRRGSFDP
jgi:hypothetical protein